MGRYHQGYFKCVNKNKYRGPADKIYYRSSWEKKLMIYLDANPSIISWSSEQVVIPYKSPLDNKFHRYFVDFYAKIRDREGNIVEYLIEVKPRKERKLPRKSKNEGKYLKEVKTYAVNQAKWEAAEKLCKKKKMIFKVMDEYDLGIKK
jgi:hypothetical protein